MALIVEPPVAFSTAIAVPICPQSVYGLLATLDLP